MTTVLTHVNSNIINIRINLFVIVCHHFIMVCPVSHSWIWIVSLSIAHTQRNTQICFPHIDQGCWGTLAEGKMNVATQFCLYKGYSKTVPREWHCPGSIHFTIVYSALNPSLCRALWPTIYVPPVTAPTVVWPYTYLWNCSKRGQGSRLKSFISKD